MVSGFSTKLMTTYLVFEAIEKGDLAPDMLLAVTPRANLQPPTRLGLGTGKTITVELAGAGAGDEVG